MIGGGGHLTAAEIAKLGLPGLPGSKRGVIFTAERQSWSWIERKGRGGISRAYAIADLPEPARAALEATRVPLIPANLRPVGRPAGSDFFTLNPAVADAVEAILADRPLAAMRILELLARRFPVLPSRRTLSRFMARLEEEKAALLASTRNPDLYKSRYKLALGRADGSVTRANQVWELDTTKADVLTKGGRIMVLGLIDRYSRRARFMIAPSESGQAVRRLLVDTIRAWGVMPETVMTDNGSGYVNASIVSALETLGIHHHRCLPGTPEGKPYVERLFGTFTRERAELLDGYAGHNVAEAQALRAVAKKRTGRALVVPALEPEELQAILDNWTEGVYNHREHSGIRMTPFRRWTSCTTPSTRAPSDDVLKIALSRRIGPARVGKRGIRWKSGRYWSDALPAWMGRMVMLRRDEDDLGAIFVFDEDGHFIDTAVNHDRAGMSEEAFARAAARHQGEWMKAARADVRAKQASFRFEDVRDEVLREDAIAAGKVTALPRPTIERATAAMDSIAARPAPALPSERELAVAIARAAPRLKLETPIADKVAAADRVIAAADAGDEVDAEALRRARLYAGSSEYRAEKMATAPFGAAASPSSPQRRISA